MKKLYVLGISTFLLVLASTLTAASGSNQGKKIYASKCANCHGKKGKGNTSIGKKMKVGSISSSLSDEELADVISSGRGKMPGYSKSLSKKKIQDVVKHIRTFIPGPSESGSDAE